MRRFFELGASPAVNRKVIALRVFFLVLLAGWVTATVLTAMSGELFVPSKRTTEPGRTVYWEDSHIGFVVLLTFQFVFGVAAIGFLLWVFEGVVRRGRTERWTVSRRPFFRKKYPH